MTDERIKARISEICSHFLFSYKGKDCGVDPFSETNFDMWCGEEYLKAKSIEAVMNTPLFDGKTLSEIANDIDIVSW